MGRLRRSWSSSHSLDPGTSLDPRSLEREEPKAALERSEEGVGADDEEDAPAGSRFGRVLAGPRLLPPLSTAALLEDDDDDAAGHPGW